MASNFNFSSSDFLWALKTPFLRKSDFYIRRHPKHFRVFGISRYFRYGQCIEWIYRFKGDNWQTKQVYRQKVDVHYWRHRNYFYKSKICCYNKVKHMLKFFCWKEITVITLDRHQESVYGGLIRGELQVKLNFKCDHLLFNHYIKGGKKNVLKRKPNNPLNQP